MRYTVVHRNASLAGRPDAEPIADEPPYFVAPASRSDDALQRTMRDGFVERGKVEMCDPLIASAEVFLKPRLELVVSRPPILEKKDRITIRRQAVAENRAPLHRSPAIEQLSCHLIGDGLQDDLVIQS